MRRDPASLVRPREVARSVTPLELFFDLVYVFTVSQLAHNLLEHVDARGMAETLVLTLAVMYAWFMTVWTSNWLDGERRPVRLMLLSVMFASLLMATSITEAFSDRAGLFVIGYLAIQIGRTAFAVAVFRGHRLHAHFVNALVWEIGTAPVWIAGIVAGGDARLALWAAAVLITYGGVIAGHPLPGRKSPFSSDSQIYAEHLLERFRLFFLIALGETVLTIGNAFVDQPVQADRLLVLAVAFAGTVALWWCYFHRAEDIGMKAIDGAADASRIVGLGNYTLILMVIGIVAIAVGDELAIAAPTDPTNLSATALIFGGPLIFLLSQLGFMRRATGQTPRSRLVACIALIALAAATAPFSLLVAVMASSAVLLAVAIDDTRLAGILSEDVAIEAPDRHCPHG
ncbi:MAG TPA: low temperature requirement protein A [Solirubrobacterales bacterium]|jgi:low temperature requirement protein LtrA|nr:low temperature requirement protein A [Solirubrobacterales bacterium]